MDGLAQARPLLRIILTFSKIYFRKVPLFSLTGSLPTEQSFLFFYFISYFFNTDELRKISRTPRISLNPNLIIRYLFRSVRIVSCWYYKSTGPVTFSTSSTVVIPERTLSNPSCCMVTIPCLAANSPISISPEPFIMRSSISFVMRNSS